MMPGRISGRRTRRRKRDLPGKVVRRELERREARVGENDRCRGDQQAVEDGVPDGGVMEEETIPGE
jgi:hypothetical protein